MTKEILMQEARKLGMGTGVFKAKDPISALTHFIGFLAAVVLMPVLLIRGAACCLNTSGMISLGIFMLSMALLYGASAAYHTFDISERMNVLFRKLDHMMIFVLIAGSYTPVCTIALQEAGIGMLAIVWGIAAAGILMMGLWLTSPNWVSSVLYIGMGWVCIGALPQILTALSGGAFAWLLTGGVVYTIGGVIYALKLPLMEKYYNGFGTHELFHCFILGGSLCHFLAMVCLVRR